MNPAAGLDIDMNGLLDAVDLGLLVVGAQARVEFTNRWMQDRLHPDLDLLGRRLDELPDAGIEPRLIGAVQAALERGHSKRLAHAFHPKPLPLYAPDSSDAERLRQAVDVIAQPTDADGVRRCLIQVRDMTEIVRREQQLKEQARRLAVELDRANLAKAELERQSLRFRDLARLAPVGLLEVDAEGRIRFFNDRACDMLRPNDEIPLGESWIRLLPLPARLAISEQWRAACQSGVDFDTEVCVPQSNGRRVWLRLVADAFGGAQQMGLGLIVTVTDVTAMRESAAALEFQARHDPLTGVANRGQVMATLSDVLQSGNERVAVLFVDLDRFKPVNDRYGHAAGDAVLKAVAERLNGTMRERDMVARIGGDEFAVIVRQAPDDDVLTRLVGRIEQTLQAPIGFGDLELTVGASIGIATCPADGNDAKSLLDAADRAMYRKKAQRHAMGRPEEAAGRTAH